MILRQLIAPAMLVLTIGCAARGPSPASLAELSRADRLVRDGCHRCLVDALAIYQRLITPSARLAGVAERAFETALLIALREKELGIPAAPALARARQLAHGVAPSSRVSGLSPDALLELAVLAQGETSGLEPEAARRPPDAAARVKTWRPALDAEKTASLARTYLSLMLDCEDRATRERLLTENVVAHLGDVPLFRFRLALCPLQQRAMLDGLRPVDARWLDAAFLEGRFAMLSLTPRLRTALAHFTDAHNAFPGSPAILLALAHTQRAMVRLEAALANYSRVIEMVPRHRDARLGRIISLTHLERREDAIAGATELLDLGTWLIPDAYYWRAFNRYHRQQFDTAWADIEQASSLHANTSVYTLAGLIAYSRRELDIAKDRFERALQMDGGNCYATWYLAVVHVDRNEWPIAAPVFSRSMGCFVKAAAVAREELAQLERSDQEPEDKARQGADIQKNITEFTLKAAQSSYNAAQGFGRAGKRGEALAHLHLAHDHPELREKAEALRKVIEALPQVNLNFQL